MDFIPREERHSELANSLCLNGMAQFAESFQRRYPADARSPGAVGLERIIDRTGRLRPARSAVSIFRHVYSQNISVKSVHPESARSLGTIQMSRREKLEEMLKSSPDDVFLHYALALDSISHGDTAAGSAGFEQALMLDPKYVPAYFQLGQVLAGGGNTSEAQSVIRNGIDVAREVGDAHAEREMSGFLAGLM